MDSLNEQALYRRIEAYSELATVVLFLIGASFRNKDLSVIGKSGDNYSSILWAKIAAFVLLIGLHVVYTVVMLFNMQADMNFWDYAALLLEVVYIALLVFAVRLLIKEHLSRLSEVWYCHKLLYAINILVSGTTLYLSTDLQVSEYCVQFNWIALVLNLILVVLTFFTEKRTRRRSLTKRNQVPLLNNEEDTSTDADLAKVDSLKAT